MKLFTSLKFCVNVRFVARQNLFIATNFGQSQFRMIKCHTWPQILEKIASNNRTTWFDHLQSCPFQVNPSDLCLGSSVRFTSQYFAKYLTIFLAV